MATRDLLVRIFGDSKSLERSFLKSTATGKVFGREMDLVGRKVDRSLTGFQSLASGRGFAGGLVATAALAGLRQLVNAASDSQQVLGQTKVALEDAGLSWDRYGKQIEGAASSLTKLGFDDEETLKVIATFARSTGDVGKAIDNAALSADVARARYIDLASASNIVLKASLGQAGALRRIGIDARNGASGVELLTLLSEKYGGSASAAAGDAATANEKLRVNLQNVQEQIGSGLLPVVSQLSDELSASAQNAAGLVKALQKVKLPGGGGIPFGKIFQAGFFLNPATQTLAIQNELRKRFLNSGTKQVASAAGDQFGNRFGLAALEAAGKAAGGDKLPKGLFGKPGNFKIPAAANAHPLTAEQRNSIFDNSISRALFRSEDLSPPKQLAALRKVAATLQARIAVTKDITRKLNLEDELISVNRQRRGVEDQLRSDAAAKAKAIQEASAKQAKALRDGAAAIKKGINDFANAFKGAGGKGPLTATHGLDTKRLLADLGLSTDQASELRGRLSGFNTAGRANVTGNTGGNFTGGRGIVVQSNVTVELNGDVVGRAVTRSQQKTRKRNPSQRRGPNRGTF